MKPISQEVVETYMEKYSMRTLENYENIQMGADEGKIMQFMYRYLHQGEWQTASRPTRIHPMTWCVGKKGIHVLGWDVETDQWRRFSIENIFSITITPDTFTPTEEFLKATRKGA